jgi:hypothetical protein
MAAGLPAMNHERVELNGAEWATHYGLVGFFLIAPCVTLVLALLGKLPARPPAEVFWLVGSSTLLAALSGWWQRRALRLRRFRTPRDAEENIERVMKVVREREWDILPHRDGRLVSALIHGYPGYRITVMFWHQDVFLNLISDPAAAHPFGISAMSNFGPNRDNIGAVIQAVDGQEEH